MNATDMCYRRANALARLRRPDSPQGMKIRTIGHNHATIKPGLVNIAYHMRRLISYQRCAGAAA